MSRPFQAFHRHQRERSGLATSLIQGARERVVYIDGRLSWFMHARKEHRLDFIAHLRNVRVECYCARMTGRLRSLYAELGDAQLAASHERELKEALRIIGEFNTQARAQFELTDQPITVVEFPFPPFFPAIWIDPGTPRAKLLYGFRLFGADLQDSPSVLVTPRHSLYPALSQSLRKFRDRYGEEDT